MPAHRDGGHSKGELHRRSIPRVVPQDHPRQHELSALLCQVLDQWGKGVGLIDEQGAKRRGGLDILEVDADDTLMVGREHDKTEAENTSTTEYSGAFNACQILNFFVD